MARSGPGGWPSNTSSAAVSLRSISSRRPASQASHEIQRRLRPTPVGSACSVRSANARSAACMAAPSWQVTEASTV